MNSIVYWWRFRAHKVANRINGVDGANELNCNSYQTLLTHVTHVTHTSLFAEYITHIAMKTRQFLVRRVWQCYIIKEEPHGIVLWRTAREVTIPPIAVGRTPCQSGADVALTWENPEWVVLGVRPIRGFDWSVADAPLSQGVITCSQAEPSTLPSLRCHQE